MTYADRLNTWNRWFDSTPEQWRAHLVLWPLIFVGFVNMQLTIAGGFPFGLLVLLAILFAASARLPYTLGWIKPPADGATTGSRIVVGRIDWLYDLNVSYDALPEQRRMLIVPAVLILAGAVNMKLTLDSGFTFGLLFLLALVVIVALRAPYTAGLLAPPPGDQATGLVPRWLGKINSDYDTMPLARRFWLFVGGVVVLGAINLDLTMAYGARFGLLYALAFLIVVALRAPYVAGWTARAALTTRVPTLAMDRRSALPAPSVDLGLSAPAEAATKSADMAEAAS